MLVGEVVVLVVVVVCGVVVDMMANFIGIAIPLSLQRPESERRAFCFASSRFVVGTSTTRTLAPFFWRYSWSTSQSLMFRSL